MDNFEIIDDRQKPIEILLAEELLKSGINSIEKLRNILEPSLFAILPVSILESDMSANAKLLYAEVMALSKKSGVCYATNEYLAKRLHLSPRTIPSLLKELKGCGLLIINIKRSEKGTFRDISISFFSDTRPRSIAMRGIAQERGQIRNRQREIDKENKTAQAQNKIMPMKYQKNENDHYEERAIDADTRAPIEDESENKQVARHSGSYGNPDINECVSFLKQQLGGSPDGTIKENRQFAKLLLNKFAKDYPDHSSLELIKRLISAGLTDSFHAKNATSFKYLYFNAQKIVMSAKVKTPKVFSI